jgi:vitamin B12/bleomycin/antimicrobial peptide transport system ATP-binding/permease protein
MSELFRQFWSLAGPYWRSEERLKSGAILFAVIVLNLGAVFITVQINLWYALFYNALQDRDFPAFSYQILRFGGFAGAYIFAGVYRVYLRQMLQIRWRNWLTNRYTARWLHNSAYYHLQLAGGTADNPDQRIQEDINNFCAQTLLLGIGLLDASVTLLSFAAILWGLSGTLEVWGTSIPGYMLWAAIFYAVAGTWLTNWIGRPLISLNFQQQRYEADLRFSLVRLRENAEGIALYGGEAAELKGVAGRLTNVVANWWGIMRRQKILTWFSSGYNQVAIIFPFLVAAPRYFSGAFQLGQLMQTVQAFDQVQTALSWFITRYPDLAEWKATVNRLVGFEKALAESEHRNAKGMRYHTLPGRRALRLEKVNIYLPDGVPLFTNLSLDLPRGSRILLCGPSGSGKSTFLRTLSGIWPYCDGEIVLPEGDSMLFLPQKPYLPLGSLRDALCYPHSASEYPRKKILETLESCGLARFADRLDDMENWALRLSPGEQQRIGFARALLSQPQWIFLDEATSALDEESEAALYELLLQSPAISTLISAAHRGSLARFHSERIVFSRQPDAAAHPAKVEYEKGSLQVSS